MIDAIKAQLPKPPDGFAWAMYEGAVFLQPNSWNIVTKEASTKTGGVGMDVYATSSEEFSDVQPFGTGLTVQIMSAMKTADWPGAKRVMAGYVQAFLPRIKDGDLLIFDQKDRLGMDSMVLRYRDTSGGLPPAIIHKFVLANDDLSAVHAYTFESLEYAWADSWERFGSTIIGRVTMVRKHI